jgi:hypothetical protein
MRRFAKNGGELRSSPTARELAKEVSEVRNRANKNHEHPDLPCIEKAVWSEWLLRKDRVDYEDESQKPDRVAELCFVIVFRTKTCNAALALRIEITTTVNVTASRVPSGTRLVAVRKPRKKVTIAAISVVIPDRPAVW